MKIYKFDETTRLTEETVLVLGYFDGLHRGHQALFAEARKIAAVLGLKIVVLTFPEKPILTFERFEHDMLLKITSDKKREALFAANGVDELYLHTLSSSFAKQTAAEFSENVIRRFNPKVVITGFDHKTGSDMKALVSTDSYKVVVVPEMADEGGKISSTRIRQAIKSGNVAEANALLGYTFETTGLVVHGFARGRQLGYPTANLVVKDFVHIPAVGVYVCDVQFAGKVKRGFASIGYNDTFDGKEETIEVHIFDFDEEIYGEELTVLWLDKIRDMMKFDDMDTLISQMKSDEDIARNWQAKSRD